MIKKLILLIIIIISMSGCNYSKEIDLTITIPKDNKEEYIYSSQEIMPSKDNIEVFIEEGLADIELKVEEVNHSFTNTSYLTSGIGAKIPLVKDNWYRIGINANNIKEDTKIILRLKNIKEVRVE